MENPRLQELPGFPEAYVEFVERADLRPASASQYPARTAFPARNGVDSAQPPLAKALARLLDKTTPALLRGEGWHRNLAKLENPSSIIILAGCRSGPAGGSMAQALKCLTAARLAAEISAQDSPAVAVCWIDPCAQPGKHGCPPGTRRADTGRNHRSEEELEPFRKEPANDVTDLINKIREYDISIDSISKYLCMYVSGGEAVFDSAAAGSRVLAWLLGECGLVVVDVSSEEFRLVAAPYLDELEAQFSDVLNGAGMRQGADIGWSGIGDDRQRESILFRLLPAYHLPVAVDVVGPEDLLPAMGVARFMGESGRSAPLLRPRVSATIFDRRCFRLMGRFGFELKELFEGSAALAGRLGYRAKAAAAASGLEHCAAGIEQGVESLCRALPGDPRLDRRIRASGARVLYQVRKLALRSRASSASRVTAAGRQLDRLCRTAAPRGALQEENLSPARFAHDHFPSAFARLLGALDIMDARHQLIVLD